MDLIITILPVVTKDLPISPRFTPCDFLSRCKFSALTTRQPMVEFYLLTFPRFPLRKKERKSYFGKNRTPDRVMEQSGSIAYLEDFGLLAGPTWRSGGFYPTRLIEIITVSSCCKVFYTTATSRIIFFSGISCCKASHSLSTPLQRGTYYSRPCREGC